MLFNLQEIKEQYNASRGAREIGKWAFALGTFGLGGLYLWATTNIIREGEIGLRQTASGEMVLLPPGRHSNFPWESYPSETKSLSSKAITMGPYKIITVDTGNVAITNNRGVLEILEVGQHLITDAAHTFKKLLSVKQETKKLHEVNAYSSDNVGLTMQADVRYQIESPELAVSRMDNIEEAIKEIAEMNISQIVGHHTLTEFAPATSAVIHDTHAEGISALLSEIKNQITAQLAAMGIKLLNIGITSWKINDNNLAHELAQGAVVKSQTQSKLMAAQNAADVKGIESRAEAEAIHTLAAGKRAAIEEMGQAFQHVARHLDGSQDAQAMYARSQQIELVSHAKNANLFFNAEGGQPSRLPPVITTIPAASSSSAARN